MKPNTKITAAATDYIICDGWGHFFSAASRKETTTRWVISKLTENVVDAQFLIDPGRMRWHYLDGQRMTDLAQSVRDNDVLDDPAIWSLQESTTPPSWMKTPLQQAAFAGSTKECVRLIELGTDVNEVTSQSLDSALHFAASEGCTPTCVALLELGAVASAKNAQGYTALDLANESNYVATCAALRAWSTRCSAIQVVAEIEFGRLKQSTKALHAP